MRTLKFVLLFICLPVYCWGQLEDSKLVLTGGIDHEGLKRNIEYNISTLLCACNSSVMTGEKLKIDEQVMLKDARKALDELWKTSPMSCPVSKVEEICIQTSTGYQVRNIPVTMMAANDSLKDQELVVSLTPKGVIDGISIAIDAHKYKEIMSEHESVEDLYRRQVIVDFVENYRTSYNRKDLDYIESVFSDNALIITGKVIKEKPKSDFALQSLGSERVVYQQRSKKQYIDNLKQVFKRNNYINVIFDEVEVIQHPKLTDIYGVTLKQEWNSDHYRDVGYVFLMIDFQDELQPLIQVRTWQPEKVNNQVLRREEVFNLGSFDIVRSLVND